MLKNQLAIVLFIALTNAAAAQTNKSLIKVTDMLKIKSVTDVTLSKDGTKAVFTVNSIEPDADSKWDYKYINSLYVVPTDGSAPAKKLTAKENASQPAFSPDGKQLAFVRTVDTKPQIFILSFDGGEPMQFTHFKYGASSPTWSPDGKKIIFAASIGLKDLIRDSILNPTHIIPNWPYEKPGIANNESLKISTAKANPDGNMDEVKAYLENDVTDKKAKVVDKLNFQDETGVNTDMSFNQFFLQDVQQQQQPESTPVAITHGFYKYFGIDFTPDGKQLVITADIDSTEHPDRSLESEIYLANTDGSNLHLLLGEIDKVYNSAKISPSGKLLAFQYGSTGFVSVPQMAIMPLNGSAKDMVSIPFDRNKSNFTWGNDDKTIYFTAQSNGGAPIYKVDVATKKVTQLSDYNGGINTFDLAANHIVFAKTEVADPSELYTADLALQNPKRISALNEDWIKDRKLSMPEKHQFTNSIGETIEYWIMKPTNYVAGNKYPLVLDIHGGPTAMWGPGEASMWHEFQFYCAKGYGVVYCNPRGSGGYGQDFLRANIEDWGTGPTSDVMTVVDKAVAEGWADTSKLVVTGGSYAGYLVAWIVGHEHRFKAACAQRGVYDLATFFGEGNAWRLVPNYFAGYPWEAKTKAILERESPIHYVQNITTPLIIFHGESDRRTGFVQGEMLYRSLKVLNKPVEYVRHPGATHDLTRSGDNRQRMDQMLRTYEFFERYIK